MVSQWLERDRAKLTPFNKMRARSFYLSHILDIIIGQIMQSQQRHIHMQRQCQLVGLDQFVSEIHTFQIQTHIQQQQHSQTLQLQQHIHIQQHPQQLKLVQHQQQSQKKQGHRQGKHRFNQLPVNLHHRQHTLKQSLIQFFIPQYIPRCSILSRVYSFLVSEFFLSLHRCGRYMLPKMEHICWSTGTKSPYTTN